MRLGGTVKLTRRRVIILSGVIMACVITGGALWITRPNAAKHNDATDALSSAVTTINTFQPYAFQVLDGFTVNVRSIDYAQDTLIFQLQNGSHQTIAVTEQLLPESVVNGIDPKAVQVPGVDGTGIITYSGTTTTGALFSTAYHNRQTMVIVSTSDPVSQTTIEDLLRGLRPISKDSGS